MTRIIKPRSKSSRQFEQTPTAPEKRDPAHSVSNGPGGFQPVNAPSSAAIPMYISWQLFVLAMLYSVVFTACVLMLWRSQQRYPDVIVGAITWRNIDKTRDFVGFGLVLLGAGLAYYGMLRLANSALRRTAGCARWLAKLLTIPLVLFAYWFGAQLIGFDSNQLPLEALMSSAVLFVFLPALVRFPHPSSRLIEQAGLLLMFDLLALVFGGFGLGFLVSTIFHFVSVNASYIAVSYTLAGLAVLGLLIWRSTSLQQCLSRLTTSTYLLQAPMPLLFFVIMPRDTLYRGQTVPAANTRLLIASLFILCLAAWASLYRRRQRSSRPLRSRLRTHIEPLCLVAITTCLVAAPAFPTISRDDFHFGEQYLPWQQLMQFGRLPYLDLIPIHGVMPFATGAINSGLFHGTVATFEAADALFGAFAVALTFLCLYRTAGIAPALLFCFVVNHLDRLYFLGPILLFLLQPRRFQSVRMWIVTIALSLFAIAYNIPVGGALLIGLFPLIIQEGVQAWRKRLAPSRRLMIGITALLAILLSIPVVRRTAIAFVQFGSETGTTNTVAHGIKWEGFTGAQSPIADALISPLLFELIKFGWLIVVLIVIALLISKVRPGRFWSSRRRLLWGIALTCIVMTPWTVGRIGSGLSRTGSLSAYCVAVFLPLVLIRYGGILRQSSAGSFVLPVIGALLGMYAVETGSFSTLQRTVTRLSPIAKVPADLIHVKGSDFNLPNLGELYMPQARLDAILRFNRTVSAFVGDSGTYFDLSNRQALYAFTHRKEPVLYATPYIAVSHQQQERILKQLAADPQKLVFVDPSMNFDGPASLRSYLLYRYVALNYRPCKVDENVFFIASSLSRSPCEHVPDHQLLDGSFSFWNLEALPSAWGSSWPSLHSLFKPLDIALTPNRLHLDGLTRNGDVLTVGQGVFDEQMYLERYPDVANAVKTGTFKSGFQHYEIYGRHEGRTGARNPSFLIDLRDMNIDPKHYDFLTFVATPTAKQTLELRWVSDLGPSTKPSTFILEGTRVLIPVGSYPEWLTANRIQSLRITIVPPTSLKTFRISDFQLLHYRPSEATAAIALK